ncbi:glycoside hydrolase family 26 protein [Pedobacter hiemivivus]|uniref:Mannan endo-1,4-beta-mannosidase n=1 Tax=Pedobacter hiemivivus TaxID=2530454 RepID=A0A4R0MCP0_9SPHI|nr:glycosyl hydrolase [Pedobacter hiemivivus]TCC83747.1 beta-mannosidase [Pedobacter hiemivivus]
MKLNKILLTIILFSRCLIASDLVNAQSLSDKAASKETVALYKNLHKLSLQHTIFGHQDDLAYGVTWKYIEGKSDIKDVVNDYPGIYGWDLGRIEHDSFKNIDGVPFDKIRKYIQDGYKKGAAITLSWHFDNPLTGGSSWDTTKNSVATILPGGAKHQLYISWLDKAAKFISSLKGDQQEAIPILFRPFHEVSGNWFWWGRNCSSPAEIKKAWQFTVDYLNNTKKLHNLIFVYNTNGFANEQEFLKYYPGDDVVDVVSFDLYQFENQGKEAFINAVRNDLDILSKIARQRNKLAAFAETGYEAVPDATWWTGTLWPAIKDYPLSYVLVWRNAGYMPSTKKMHYYAPFEGQISAPDFKKFYQNKRILFEKTIGTKKIYQPN